MPTYKHYLAGLFLGGISALTVATTSVQAEEVEQPVVDQTPVVENQPAVENEQPVEQTTEPVVEEQPLNVQEEVEQEQPIVEQGPKNGFVQEDGKTYYYINDVKQTNQKKIDGYWYMFDQKSGEMQTGFVQIASQNKTVYYDELGHMLYGYQNIGDNWYWFNTASGKREFTGVVQNTEDGKWYFVRNGIGELFTGWSKSIENGKWYFTENGILDWSFTGVAKSVENGRWYHGKKGYLDWKFTGFSKSIENGRWYFSRKGVLDWAFTGVAKSVENGRWYHGKKGCLDWGFTGFSKSVENGKWYFSRKGCLDWAFTGVAKSVENGRWYHGKKGQLDWGYTGVSRSVLNDRLFYVKKGALDWSYTGMEKFLEDNQQYFCVKGAVQHETSGLTYNPSDCYHYMLENGRKISKKGLHKIDGYTYLFFNENSGIAVNSFEYLKKYGKRQISYFDVKGHLMTGKFTAQGHTYQADKNGAIQDKTVNRVMWCLDLADNDYHGYSLYRRTSRRDYDCSSMVYYSLLENGFTAAQMGLNTPFTTFIMDQYMTRLGFKRYTYASVRNSLRLGDVLVGNTLFDHTETFFGNGMTVGAHSGDLDGTWGDSSGNEISVVSNSKYDYGWEFVYRQV